MNQAAFYSLVMDDVSMTHGNLGSFSTEAMDPASIGGTFSIWVGEWDVLRVRSGEMVQWLEHFW